MRWNTSLQMKMVMAFALVLTPLIFFLYYITLYSMDVVRVQVAQSNQNLLSTYVRQMDRSLLDMTNYLHKQVLNDTDLKTLGIYEAGSEAYDLSQVSLSRRLNMELNNHPAAGAFFVYDRPAGSFIVGYRDQRMDHQLEEVRQHIEQTDFTSSWTVLRSGGAYALLKIVSFDSKIYMGAWVPLSNLTQSIEPFNFGREGDIFLISRESVPLTAASLSGQGLAALEEALRDQQQPYRILANPEGEGSRLTLWMKLNQTDLHLVISIPEKNVLLQLPFYKKVTYLIPLVCIVILCVYFFLLRRILLLPMNRLLAGMRKMGQGDLRVQLPEGRASEFSYLIHTFNQMVSEIGDLKIHNYEERLKVQQAEFKYLQAQINPHFYLNTLNIIYNSAVLQDHETVKTLSLHLADFFRFRIRKNRDEVTLQEELDFIEGYLSIQQLRFLELLSYSIIVDPALAGIRIPPLTVQPFVENSIVHGFRGFDGPLHIRVEVRPAPAESGSCCEIHITDNGPGFPPDRLELLNRSDYLADGANSDAHIGLWNVYHRLRMKYEDRARMEFHSGQPQGATVILSIPC